MKPYKIIKEDEYDLEKEIQNPKKQEKTIFLRSRSVDKIIRIKNQNAFFVPIWLSEDSMAMYASLIENPPSFVNYEEELNLVLRLDRLISEGRKLITSTRKLSST